MGGTRRDDEVHGNGGPRSWAGEQLFARVAAVPEMTPQPALFREGWRRNLFQKGRGFSCICVVSKTGNCASLLKGFATVLLLHLCLSGLLHKKV